MAQTTKEENIDQKDLMQKERRSFLKKTAYSAPALIVLGQLAKPVSLAAENSAIDDNNGPGGGFGGPGV